MRTTAMAALMASALLGGCAGYDRVMVTDFKPTGSGGFEYRGFADAVYPLDTQEGERSRLAMLDRWLEENAMCPRGYEITSRQPVRRARGLLADVHDVYYVGRCSA